MRAVNGTEALPWLCERAKCCLTSRAKAIAAVDDAGRVRGMVGYDNFTQTSCEAHWAIETPLALRALIPAIFTYPFIDLQLLVVVGIIPADNARSLSLIRHLGFHETHRVRDGWKEGVAMVVHELRPEDVAQHIQHGAWKAA